ncbi:MAG: hypothetical protein AAF602_02110 [Myxococcota bacterium]
MLSVLCNVLLFSSLCLFVFTPLPRVALGSGQFAATSPSPDDDDAVPTGDSPYCGDGIWFAGTCRSPEYFGSELGISSHSAAYVVMGASPSFDTKAAFDNADTRLGAVLYLEYANGDQYVLHLADDGTRPVVVRSHEITSVYAGGWSLRYEATYEWPLDRQVGPQFAPSHAPSSSILSGPSSVWLPGREASWWEMRGDSGSRFFNYGSDYDQLAIAYVSSDPGEDACDAHAQQASGQYLSLCNQVKQEIIGDWTHNLQLWSLGNWGIAVFSVVAAVGTGGMAVAVEASFATVVASAGLPLAAGTVLVTGLESPRSAHQSSLEQFERAADDFCAAGADARLHDRKAECLTQRELARREGYRVLHVLEPVSEEGTCPAGTHWYAPGTTVLSCQTAQVTIHGPDEQASFERVCVSISLPSGACVREISAN